MKRILSLIISCALFGTVLVTGCSSEPEQTAASEVSGITQEQIEENIVGMWLMTEVDGHPALTSEMRVLDIVSTSQAYSSMSRVGVPYAPFVKRAEASVDINGNVLTVTINDAEGHSPVQEYVLSEINANRFTGSISLPVGLPGESSDSEPVYEENTVSFTRISDDFSGDIIGAWEGHCTSEGSYFDDGYEHRWEFRNDGSYVYYTLEGDSWVAAEDSSNDYFVAGTLLCLRWTEGEIEYREWWEVSIGGDTMSWVARCENDDGTTYTATFEMTRVAE